MSFRNTFSMVTEHQPEAGERRLLDRSRQEGAAGSALGALSRWAFTQPGIRLETSKTYREIASSQLGLGPVSCECWAAVGGPE